MATPKTICSKMEEIFKKFLWGGVQQLKKLSLVAWSNLMKPNMEGGLGLRDPFILNQVLGIKLWWIWAQGGMRLWKHIWMRKYGMPNRTKDILRYWDPPKCCVSSLIVQVRERVKVR